MCVNKTGIDVTCYLQIFESSLFKGITALNFNAPHWLLFMFIQVYQVYLERSIKYNYVKPKSPYNT